MYSAEKSLCSMCHEVFKDSALLEFDGLPFCKTHHKLLINSSLAPQKSIVTSAANPEASVAIHNEQMSQYRLGKVCYLKTEYVERDGEIFSRIILISN